MFKFKRVYIPTNESQEVELTKEHVGNNYNSETLFEYFKRQDFLELINDWNRRSVLQSSVNGNKKIEWFYIAL